MPLAEQSRPLCLRRRQKLQKLQVTEVAIEAQRHTKAEAEEPAERGEVRPNRNTDLIERAATKMPSESPDVGCLY